MDTLSGSVSSLKIPTAAATTLRHKSHQLHHHFNHQHPAGHLIISSKQPNNYKTSTPAFTHNHNNNLSTSNNQLPFLNNASSSPVVKQSAGSKAEEFHHKKASTGYAVALLDAARAQNVLELAKKDVKKLSKWLSNEQLSGIIENPNMEKKEKGEILKEIMKKGKFNNKHLGKLVKLLVEKNKVEMITDVLLEFQRMYDELSSNDHQVVLIPAGMKLMEENQILGIAKITGADKVMVITC
ncbi:hypothetical protein MIMGU_mgv1a012804mg [Erythranthe guttata]|uniref:ATP synthase delta chain, chloroplastic n=1 Tax=Erythranthe guttata TaxID=4155 RepID=A0A022QWL1_ERYGU|nr:PREDICTED: uncharacterized protein LOC105963938 [Erythranthe guttata]EYU32281.1 hypothetical protein MIMGU_mgv1a012804mg [Erythranthe guttata]|eukprot:XP_012843889.1 PREDICTED: uncharacterized protein LOC105963938 [Erythranthe guttata]